MIYSNVHTHTTYSDGKNSMEDNVLEAIKLGIKTLGFSDHSYTYYDDSYCMPENKLNEYLQEGRRLQKRYENQIDILVGIEADGTTAQSYKDKLDYTIGDIHYLFFDGKCFPIDYDPNENQLGPINTYCDGSVLKYAKVYFEAYYNTIKEIKPTILGHYDLITKFSLMPEENSTYIGFAKEILKETLKICPVIEINTGAISRGYRKTPYPIPALLKDIPSFGGKIILSSDSHQKENLQYGFNNSIALLKSIGINSVVELTKTGFVESPLN
ncbi:MAG: histidinol-phosphatase HisJ family protein [Sphaerochaetaceae bacterium]|nr:histidinol-phosphatase HisJ family protein [Sphaerochaetaceae bacterium]